MKAKPKMSDVFIRYIAYANEMWDLQSRTPERQLSMLSFREFLDQEGIGNREEL